MRISDFTVDVLIRIYIKKLLVKILALITFRLSGRRKESIIFCPPGSLYGKVGERARFLLTCCEEKKRINEWVSVSSQPVSKKNTKTPVLFALQCMCYFFQTAEINYRKMLYQSACTILLVMYMAENSIQTIGDLPWPAVCTGPSRTLIQFSHLRTYLTFLSLDWQHDLLITKKKRRTAGHVMFVDLAIELLICTQTVASFVLKRF